MASARELLEQADALMKRNRSAQGDDIPLLTDSVSTVPEAQVLRGRGALARGGVPLPSTPVPDEGDSIPTLRDSIDDDARDEVLPEEGGEPSDWLQRDAGEPSITGDVPDSILVVPPADDPDADDEPRFAPSQAPVTPTIAPEAVTFDDVPELHDAAAVGELAEDGDSGNADAAAALEVPPDTFDDALELPATEEIEVVAPPVADPLAGLETIAHDDAVDSDDIPTLHDVPATAVAPAEADGTFARWQAFDDVAAPAPLVEAPLAQTPPAADVQSDVSLAPVAQGLTTDPLPVAAIDPAAEAARWDGVAEEIRMQVLQRIDIFTDTGLREQLAMRLQPIVDRASADLVATINQHVGELLRAYVAEAIEREIESWRRSH